MNNKGDEMNAARRELVNERLYERGTWLFITVVVFGFLSFFWFNLSVGN